MTRSQNRRIKAGQRAFLDDLELGEKKKMCLAYETEISGIGRDQVAKAIEYGRFLNELYDADFATRHEDGRRLPKSQQPRYWKKWSSTVKQWGLNEKTLSNYRLLADEARDEDFAVKLAEFSLLTDAYRAARRQRSERRLEKAQSEYDHALEVADSSCADRAISLEEASREASQADRALDDQWHHSFVKIALGGSDEVHDRLVKDAEAKRGRYERAQAANDSQRDAEVARQELEKAQRVAHATRAGRSECAVRFWANDDGTLGYAHRDGSGSVPGFDQLWRQVADSAFGALPEPGSTEWKSMLGRFVADAVIAHVQKGLVMAENGDTDAACALLGQVTSAETQAVRDASWNAHGTSALGLGPLSSRRPSPPVPTRRSHVR